MTHNVFSRWIKNYFSDPEGVILAVLLALVFGVIIFMGEMLAPLLASVVIAYLLEGVVAFLQRYGMRRMWAVLIVFTLFLALLIYLSLVLIPQLSSQVTQLIQIKVPVMLERWQRVLLTLPERYPDYISSDQVRELMNEIASGVRSMGQSALSVSLSSISTVFTALVFLVLVPVLVFFLLKDKELLVRWLTGLLPRERGLATRVWHEMNQQIGNYVRGKFSEVFLVGIVTYVCFAVMGLQYATLLGALVGLSVIVPYIGAVVVTLPVALIAYFQWGSTMDFVWLMVAYGIIQGLDGNVLVPLLFSEAVNLHPVAIIAAILVFGGIWGFWGVFFAIPLATLVKAVINAWPRAAESKDLQPAESAT